MAFGTATSELVDTYNALKAKAEKGDLDLAALCEELGLLQAAKVRALEQGNDLALIGLNARLDLVSYRLRTISDSLRKTKEEAQKLTEDIKSRIESGLATEAPNGLA